MNYIFATVNHESKISYLLGDYHINLLNYEIHQLTASFVCMLYSYSYISPINRLTRITEHFATLIKNNFSNIEASE